MKKRLGKNVLIFFLCAAFFVSCSGAEKNGSDGDSLPGDIEFPSALLEYTGDENYRSPKTVSANAESAENQSVGLDSTWWKDTAFYHIWVKSFCDSDGDGCGDFKGIESKLDYIREDVGCDGIWLSPVFECDYKTKTEDGNMHGYDVRDYYAVNSYFGTEEDLVSLINACHDRNMKIIFDFVPNHTGKGNRWFTESCEGGGKKDWYVWNSSKLSWNPGMGTSDTWHKNPSGSGYYYAAFWEGQPDLNFRNYEVREEMKNVVRWWLNKGFDGLRIDAVRYLVETEDALVDTDETHEWFKELRADVIDAYKDIAPKFMTCEAWIEDDRSALESYFGTEEEPEFNMVFDFDQGRGCRSSIERADSRILASTLHSNPSGGLAFGTFIGNHDEYMGRIGTWYRGYGALIKLISAMSLLRPTVPFMYYGNEIGMKEGNYSGDLRLRTPFDWDEAERQRADASSVLSLNKALLALRREYPALFRNGNVTKLKSCTRDAGTGKPEYSAAAYTVSDGKDTLLCVFSLFNCGDNEFWFELGDIDISSYSVLVGINSDKNLSVYNNDALYVKYIAPYEARVYYLGDDSKEMLFTDSRLFLRGSMNDWGYQEMVHDAAERTFSVEYELDGGIAYLFKFDVYCDWTLTYGSGINNTNGTPVRLGEKTAVSTEKGDDTNFVFTPPSGGAYLFTFYEDDKTFLIQKG